jgi:hypothetical protein
MKAVDESYNKLNLDEDLRDLLVATINPDNTVTLSDPNAGAIPVDMSYCDVKIIGLDGTEIIVDGGNHPVVYTMTAVGILMAFMVGFEWRVTDQDIVDAFQNKCTTAPLGLTLGEMNSVDLPGAPNAQV